MWWASGISNFIWVVLNITVFTSIKNKWLSLSNMRMECSIWIVWIIHINMVHQINSTNLDAITCYKSCYKSVIKSVIAGGRHISKRPLVHCGCTRTLRGLCSTARAPSSLMAKPARRMWAQPCSSYGDMEITSIGENIGESNGSNHGYFLWKNNDAHV